MINVLYWYLVLLLLGIAFYPAVLFIFKSIGYKGLTFAKIYGLLFVTLIGWLLSSLFKIPINNTSLIIILIFSGLIQYSYLINRIRRKLIGDLYDLKGLFFEELIFLTLFVLYILFKASNPSIQSIEKIMDHAILNGLVRTEILPTQDVWFSGNPINYYYFGHLIISNLVKLTNIPTAIAFNLAVATMYALSGTAIFTLVKKLTNSVFAGITSLSLLLFAGNLNFVFNKLLKWSNETYYYADDRSLIEYTINEFPAYSFLIGDLHAHILNIPNVILFIAFLFTLQSKDIVKYPLVNGLFGATVLSVLFLTNSWDYAIYTPLLLLTILFLYRSHKDTIYRHALLTQLYIFPISLLIITPFLLGFIPPTSGILFTLPRNDITQILVMFGGLLIITIILIIKYKITRTINILYILLLIFAFILIVIPEFVVLKDIYFKYNPQYMRANTFFKVWYQAWIILAVLGGASISIIKYLQSNALRKVLLIFVITVLLSLCSYTIYSVSYLVDPTYTYRGLDGSAYLAENNKGTFDVINWINNNIKEQGILLEAYGTSYKLESMFSSFTGLPTIVGWNEHELGWRDNWPVIVNRMGDIEKLYTSKNTIEIKKLLELYKIKYFVIGDQERIRYGTNAGVTLKMFGEQLYESEGIYVYLVKSL